MTMQTVRIATRWTLMRVWWGALLLGGSSAASAQTLEYDLATTDFTSSADYTQSLFSPAESHDGNIQPEGAPYDGWAVDPLHANPHQILWALAAGPSKIDAIQLIHVYNDNEVLHHFQLYYTTDSSPTLASGFVELPNLQMAVNTSGDGETITGSEVQVTSSTAITTGEYRLTFDGVVATGIKLETFANSGTGNGNFVLSEISVRSVDTTVAVPLERTLDDPNPTLGDSFGRAVAMDGNRILIGAYGDDTFATFAGQAYLFDKTSGAHLRTFDEPTESRLYGQFGTSVAIQGDRVVVGSARLAHLFDASTGSVLHTFSDPTPTIVDRFGKSVAIDGDRVVVGAYRDDTQGSNVGQAHLFDTTTGNLIWTFVDPTVTTEDNFGESVAIDGDNVLIGAPGDDTHGAEVGQAHLFDASTGGLVRTFVDPSVSPYDQFGQSVAIQGDRVLIGAPGDATHGIDVGQVYLFDRTDGSLLLTFNDPTPTTADLFGGSVSIDGDYILIGAYRDDTHGTDIGQSHLFNATTGILLATLDDPTVTTTDLFARSVAVDGNHLLVGAGGDMTYGNTIGQAHLFAAPFPAGVPALPRVWHGLFFVGLLASGTLVLARKRA